MEQAKLKSLKKLNSKKKWEIFFLLRILVAQKFPLKMNPFTKESGLLTESQFRLFWGNGIEKGIVDSKGFQTIRVNFSR